MFLAICNYFKKKSEKKRPKYFSRRIFPTEISLLQNLTTEAQLIGRTLLKSLDNDIHSSSIIYYGKFYKNKLVVIQPDNKINYGNENKIKNTIEIKNTDDKNINIDTLPNYDSIENVDFHFDSKINLVPPFTIGMLSSDDITIRMKPYLDNIKDNILSYKINSNKIHKIYLNNPPEKITINYVKYKTKIEYNNSYYSKPKYEKFYRNGIKLQKKFDIIKNFKLCIPKKVFDNYFFSIVVTGNIAPIYQLMKYEIYILQCYDICGDYIYVDMIYFPDLYLYLLPYTEINIYIKYNCIRNISFFDGIYLYYEGENIPGNKIESLIRINPIMDEVKILDIDNLYRFIETKKQIHLISNEIRRHNKFNNFRTPKYYKSEIICKTDLSSIFKFFGMLSKKSKINRIPVELWQYIDPYLEKDLCYINIIMMIYKKDKLKDYIYFNDKIIFITFNKLVYNNGLIRCIYI